MSAQTIEPIRVTQTLRPVAITNPKPGVYVYDMGQNMVGWCRLRASGPSGSQIRLRFAETLRPDGMLYTTNLRGARTTDYYVLNGQGVETWEPRFTYHGFRFVEMTGFPGNPTLDTLAGRVVNDDVPTAGTFNCSNPLLNQIHQNIMWGVRGNYSSMPTDCPQRDERQGWLGDRAGECKGESYLFNIAALYSKWLRRHSRFPKTHRQHSRCCPPGYGSSPPTASSGPALISWPPTCSTSSTAICESFSRTTTP